MTSSDPDIDWVVSFMRVTMSCGTRTSSGVDSSPGGRSSGSALNDTAKVWVVDPRSQSLLSNDAVATIRSSLLASWPHRTLVDTTPALNVEN